MSLQSGCYIERLWDGVMRDTCRWGLIDLGLLGLAEVQRRTTFDEESWAALCLFGGALS